MSNLLNLMEITFDW